MTPRRLVPCDTALPQLVTLIRAAFADMPLSPACRLMEQDLHRKLDEGAGYVIDGPTGPLACLFTRPSRDVPGALYIGTLAVGAASRGKGLARRLIEIAAQDAGAAGHHALTLDTGAAETRLQAMFTSMGFTLSHIGPEVVTMLRALPRQLAPQAPDMAGVLALLHRAFAYMEGRIDPPSSLHRLTVDALNDQARTGEIWVTGSPIIACMVLSPRNDCLYLGKLAVDSAHRGAGLAGQMITLAETRARALGLPALELQSRIELTEVHAVFRAYGFVETGRTTHDGYPRPTSITFRRPVN